MAAIIRPLINSIMDPSTTPAEPSAIYKVFVDDINRSIDDFKATLPPDILVSITLSEDSSELAIKGKYLALSIYKINPA